MIKLDKDYLNEFFNSTINIFNLCYLYNGDNMKVKIIDEAHEKDLEEQVNAFLSTLEGEIIDIKFQTAIDMYAEEQIYCFTAFIIYTS